MSTNLVVGHRQRGKRVPYGANKMGDDVHRFGNLCLISPSSNSKLSNYSPTDKKKSYVETERVESLKQAIMMSYGE